MPLKFFKKHWPIFFLSATLVVLFYKNYTPNTWLLGWDNLQIELNPLLNIKRSLLSVWQEYQGLGLLTGMAHASDLPRQIFVLLISFFLPQHFIRYFYHFLMIALATFGSYSLTKYILKENKSQKITPVISSLFYLLNFGTIQYLNLPFEPYSTFFAAFPWLLLVIFKLLKKPNKKTWLNFIIIHFLSIPSFYVQTIFLVYSICLCLILLAHSYKKNLPKQFKFKSKILITIFLINSFWLLPNIYFTLTQINTTQNAFANKIITDQFIEENKKHGHLKDFALLIEPYYDQQNNHKQNNSYLLPIWHKHLDQTTIQFIGYILFIISVLGLFTKNKHKKYFTHILLFTSIGLLSTTFPFKYINSLFLSIPILKQIFRNSFTKLLIPTTLSLSILLGLSINQIKIPKKIKNYLYILLVLLIFIFSWPSFKGYYFNPKMRLSLPSQYLHLTDFFKTQPKTSRIMNLPLSNFWGWHDWRWGQKGSGFLWYGIEQPILDRAFDVWNLKNEQYYWELSYALQKEDLSLFENILQKYNISYVLVDNNIFFPSNKEFSKIHTQTEKLINRSNNLKLMFEVGKITVYKYLPTKSSIYVTNNLTTTQNFNGFINADPVFGNYGDYTFSSSPQVIYPFTNLFTNRLPSEFPYNVSVQNNNIVIEKPNFHSTIPINQQIPLTISPPTDIILNSFQNPIVTTSLQDTINIPVSEFINPHLCAPQNQNSKFSSEIKDDTLTLSATGTALCIDWQNYDFFKQFKQPKIINLSFDYKSISDEWPKSCFWNGTKCLNNKDLPNSGFNNTWKYYSETSYFDPITDQNTVLSLIIDSTYDSKDHQISYKNVTMQIFDSPNNTSKPQDYFSITKDNNTLTATIPSNNLSNNLIQSNLFHLQPQNCNSKTDGSYSRQILKENNNSFIRLSSINNNSCITFPFPNLPLNQSYLIKLTYRHQKGYPLLTYAYSDNQNYKYFETKLEKQKNWQTAWFVIPAFDNSNHRQGLGISFNNKSFNQFESINDIQSIQIYPFPYDQLLNYKITPDTNPSVPSTSTRTYLPSISNIFYYKTKLRLNPLTPQSTIVLNQSFDSGWIAFYFNGIKPVFLKNHILVNNWANGWNIDNIPQNANLYIFFWPQLLEFLGFALLIPVFIYIFKSL
ncbi:hypothetical protein KKC08_02895 [Patescibacteria group bacterium]|nr:hypothetical protein [Patescibacteria group bacterium]MCG2701651.1 hypothetical protein [Candidatus Parcubacteria bacterium]MBU4264999.1 hypothetical protein [Patescibacteria group bacterium]MBU4390152.1 hypothetical protein [Patescibacteria group bacterium]MBU4397085.1 hypothetical protein [Patescibacteria group bacterium]